MKVCSAGYKNVRVTENARCTTAICNIEAGNQSRYISIFCGIEHRTAEAEC